MQGIKEFILLADYTLGLKFDGYQLPGSSMLISQIRVCSKVPFDFDGRLNSQLALHTYLHFAQDNPQMLSRASDVEVDSIA